MASQKASVYKSINYLKIKALTKINVNSLKAKEKLP